MEERACQYSRQSQKKGIFSNTKDYVVSLVLAIYGFFYLFVYSMFYPVNTVNRNGGTQGSNSNGGRSGGGSGGSGGNFRSFNRGSGRDSMGSGFSFRGMGGMRRG